MSHHDREWNQDADKDKATEPDLVDTLAVIKAEIDQMVSIAPEMARASKGWFDAFKDEGFSDNQALYLTAVQIKDNPGPAPS